MRTTTLPLGRHSALTLGNKAFFINELR